MHTDTTTATGHAGLLVVVALVVILVGTGWYSLSCWMYPLSACGRCKGTGKRRSLSGRTWRLCKRCKATGGRPRLGRRLTGLARDGRRK